MSNDDLISLLKNQFKEREEQYEKQTKELLKHFELFVKIVSERIINNYNDENDNLSISIYIEDVLFYKDMVDVVGNFVRTDGITTDSTPIHIYAPINIASSTDLNVLNDFVFNTMNVNDDMLESFDNIGPNFETVSDLVNDTSSLASFNEDSLSSEQKQQLEMFRHLGGTKQ